MPLPGKSFPFFIPNSTVAGKCTVWLGEDYKRDIPDLVVCLQTAACEEKRKAVISSRNPFAEFYDLDPNEEYRIKVNYHCLTKRLLYAPHAASVSPVSPENKIRVIGIGSGRCGTTSLASYLDGMIFNDGSLVVARHETAAFPVMHCIIHQRNDLISELIHSFSHNVEIAPYYWLVPEVLERSSKVVVIIRDGRQVVHSGMLRGWYTRDSLWDEIKPEFQGSPFEKCCQYWVKCNEVLKPLADIVVRCRDMQESVETRRTLLRTLDMKIVDKPFPRKNHSRGDVSAFVWNAEHGEIFHRICGKLMDEYYPGWEKDDNMFVCF